MKKYIEDHCGIHLADGKEYLIESRLTDLVQNAGCSSFQEFHYKARTDTTGQYRDQIVDAMTTNETMWFRDRDIWEYLQKVAIPKLIKRALAGEKIRIWSSAASTGQEPYSLLILLDEAVRAMGLPGLPENLEFWASDISSSALFIARLGRYDDGAMKRGMPESKKAVYFKKHNHVWIFNENLKQHIHFFKFNLQDSFTRLGLFDLVLCRYVVIYFSDTFKKELMKKMANVIKTKGFLILGATESLRGLSDDFEIEYYKNAIVNIRK